MVQFITLYSFLIRKKKSTDEEFYIIMNNWKQGILYDENNIMKFTNNKCNIKYSFRDNNIYKFENYGEKFYIIYLYNNGIIADYYDNKYSYLWDINGNLWSCYETYKMRYHGSYYHFYKNKNLLKCHYIHGVLHGAYKVWDCNNILIEDSLYDNGNKIEKI